MALVSCKQRGESNKELESNTEIIKHEKMNVEKDIAELEFITSEFMRCIKEKDKDAFLSLFYNDSTPWLGKFEPKSEQITRDNNPDAINPKGIFDISKFEFIDMMVGAPATVAIEEKFSNLQIDTDGWIASVNFDYEMFMDDKMTNSGREFWHLVKTNDGWKISSVVYSVFY
jgi:hypothetical protein